MAPRKSQIGESKNCTEAPRTLKSTADYQLAMLTCSEARSPVLRKGKLLTVKIQNTAQEGGEPQHTSSWMGSTVLAPTGLHWVKLQWKAEQLKNEYVWHPTSVQCLLNVSTQGIQGAKISVYEMTFKGILRVSYKSLPHSSPSCLHPIVYLNTQFSKPAHLHRNWRLM